MSDISNNEEAREAAKKLLVLLKDPHLVSDYIRRFGLAINAKNIKEIKERRGGKTSSVPPPPTSPIIAARMAAAAKAQEAAAATAAAAKQMGKPAANKAPADEEEQDPIFDTMVNCPVCGHTNITSYELRAKSQQMIQTAFLVPVYTGANGYKTANYSLLAVAVCPCCLFASPDRKNFNYPSFTGNREEVSSLPVTVIMALKDKIEERKALLPAAVDNNDYFKRERSPEVAIESYRLAVARAESEVELMQPYGYFKMGSYLLKIAHIMKTSGKDDTQALAEALSYFEKSFLKSECQSDELEMQVVYLIVALFIRLGNLNQANSYLSVFGKIMIERQEQMKKNPSLNTHWIEKWQDKARYLWEERENPDAFDRMR
ncbi:MAG: DUF2225 domain-containing protein [Chitinispirillales bacterium]|jgi:uncharacterized protein (DUF2225 family)|nr:DUF2225 domain-containing protein [Chitinispirillales bacterium]